MDLAIHHHKHPVPAGLRAPCHLHRLKQIQRTIGTEGCGRTHRSHQHHGPRIINQQLQQPGGFFQSVGAMGDHHSLQFRGLSKSLTDSLHQLDPMLKLQISTIQVGELFHLNLGHLLQLRQLLE